MGYKITRIQYNAKGTLVTSAESKAELNTEDEILDFTTNSIIDSYKIYHLIGRWEPSYLRIKLSYPINLTIVDCENNAEINLRLERYQNFLREFDNAGLHNLIKTELKNAKRPNYFKQAKGAKPPVDIVFGQSQNNCEGAVKFENETLEEALSDFEVFAICRGLTDKQMQRLSRDFFEGKEIAADDFSKAHEVVNEAIKKYGKEHIEYLVQLPSMPFKTDNVRNLFCEMERNRRLTGKPEVTINLKSKDSIEEIQISYFNVESRDVIKVTDKSGSGEICLIDKNGILVPGEKNKRILPILRLLLRTSNEIGEKVIYYGHKTGNCYLCGRLLTDLESVKIGLGPICRQTI